MQYQYLLANDFIQSGYGNASGQKFRLSLRLSPGGHHAVSAMASVR
jgi:hypothetical protein